MTYEERLVKDVNGFWNAQCRIHPVAEWEPNDGWRTFCIGSCMERVIDRMKPEFTRSYWDQKEAAWYDWDY